MGSPPAINGDLREGSDTQPPRRGPLTLERQGGCCGTCLIQVRLVGLVSIVSCIGRVEGGPARAPYCRVE